MSDSTFLSGRILRLAGEALERFDDAADLNGVTVNGTITIEAANDVDPVTLLVDFDEIHYVEVLLP